MLDLNAINWSELLDAYGTASDVPALLQEIRTETEPKTDAQPEPWFSLWSRLCHQDSVFSASYAAVPFIIQAIRDARGSVDMNFFLLPTCIELARQRPSAPAIPSALKADYLQALAQLGELAAQHTNDPDEHIRRAATAATMVAHGQLDDAAQLLDTR
jgi:hypothetical protein